ncbi:protein-tyrosine phosphatase-like protein [Daedaleopsis nitida]|nr:protein-tyrosine phosphatase-like protein [Daedaleopsis nitida]
MSPLRIDVDRYGIPATTTSRENNQAPMAPHLRQSCLSCRQPSWSSALARWSRGAKIEIIHTTVSFGARTVSAVTEIWDVTNNRLPGYDRVHVGRRVDSESPVACGTLFAASCIIAATGVEQLRALGIRKIFDLRADVEVAKYGSVASALRAVEGVEVVRAPILDEAMDPVGIAKRLKSRLFAGRGAGVPADEHKLLVHLRDHPDEPCLVHCTAGKDRSGMLAAVILLLLGAREEDVVADYALTTVGLQPMLPLLIARFQKEDVYRDNWQGALNIATAKPRSMEAVIEMLRREYGGVEGYIRQHTALTDDDIARVRANMLVPAGLGSGSGDDA